MLHIHALPNGSSNKTKIPKGQPFKKQKIKKSRFVNILHNACFHDKALSFLTVAINIFH